MSRYPGPPSVPGQPMPSVGVYSPSGMPTHMPSPQAGPPYSGPVPSPMQYGQQPGPSPTPTHYSHQSSQPVMMNPSGPYGQQMMHGMMPGGVPPPQPQPPPQVPPNQPQVPQPAPQPTGPSQAPPTAPSQQAPALDDLGAIVKRAYRSFESNLKAFLHEYSSILQMDDARMNSQTPEFLAQYSQRLVRHYESLLVSLDLFEANLRMLQDYNVAQLDFRRVASASVSDLRRTMTGGQGDPNAYPGYPPFNRPVDSNQYQLFLARMQGQIDALNAVREIGKKFVESSSTQLNPSGK